MQSILKVSSIHMFLHKFTERANWKRTLYNENIQNIEPVSTTLIITIWRFRKNIWKICSQLWCVYMYYLTYRMYWSKVWNKWFNFNSCRDTWEAHLSSKPVILFLGYARRGRECESILLWIILYYAHIKKRHKRIESIE